MRSSLCSTLIIGLCFLVATPVVFSAPSDTLGTPSASKSTPYTYFASLRKPFRLPLFYDDASLYRFVSRTTSLTDRQYAPDDLLSISGSNINEAGRRGYIRSEAKDAPLSMGKDFAIQFREPLVVISGYRSANYQERMWDLGKCTDTLCAPPGYSEHQLGLAVDLFDATTEKDFETNPRYIRYVAWLQQNAHFYGWTQSYQKGEAVDEYEVEPWHWRYIGVDMATKLRDLGWTYTEYVRFQESIQGR